MKEMRNELSFEIGYEKEMRKKRRERMVRRGRKVVAVESNESKRE